MRAGRHVLWFAVFFLLALLPRLSPVAAGLLFADDFEHTAVDHLKSHRPLNYVELAFWRGVAGERYLLGTLPKIVAAVYSALFCLALRGVLLGWGAPATSASVAALLVPLHPIWNTFIVWNVTGVYLLSLTLFLVGYACLGRPRRGATFAGVFLMAAAISGYQVHLGLLPALVFAEIALDREKQQHWLRIAIRRLASGAAAMALYLLAARLLVASGIVTWGGRGMDADVSLQRVRAVIDNVAILTQPLLSFHLGLTAAWRFWLLPLVALAGLVFLAAFRQPNTAIIRAAAIVALPALAAAVILPINTIPTGPRVASAIWLSLLLAAVPSFPRPRWAVAAAVLFAAIAIPVCIADAANWTRAWRADLQTVEAVQRFWTVRHVRPSDVTVLIARQPVPADSPAAWTSSRPVVLQNFQPVTPWHYSNVTCCTWPLFRALGFDHVQWTDAPIPLGTAISPVAHAAHDEGRRLTFLTPRKPR